MNENLFTTNGAGRRQAWFEVDGSTGNDSWGRQTIFSNLPLDTRAGDDGARRTRSRRNTAAAPAAPSTSSPRAAAASFHGERAGQLGGRPPPRPRSRASPAPTPPAATTSPTTRWTRSALSLGGPLGRPHDAFLRGRRIQPRESRFADHLAGRARQLRRAIIAAGWASSAWTTRSTTRTRCSSAATWTAFTTPIPTASWAATACPPWLAPSAAAPIRRNWARPRC